MNQLVPIANHLWQSTLFAAAAGLLTLLLKNNRAQTRYWLWLAASVKFLVPFSLLVAAGTSIGHQMQALLPQPLLPQPLLPQPNVAPASLSFDQDLRSATSVIQHFGQPFSAPNALPPMTASTDLPLRWFPDVLFVVWGIGCIAIVCFWGLRLLRLRATLRAASPLPLPIPMDALTSREFSEPGVFGILRPVLLLPTGITSHLTAPQLDAVLAHELCHVRRHDNLTGVIHMVVEAAFWFHPLVWWLGARLMEERERACDEEVLRAGNDRQVYAEGILKVCELYFESSLRCVAGVTGANLQKRIEGIMSNSVALKLNFVKKLSLSIAGATMLVLPIGMGAMNARPSLAPAQTVAPPAIGEPVVGQPLLVATPVHVVPPTPSILAQQVGQPTAPQPVAASQQPEGVAVILIIDRSSSMEGKKMRLASYAAASVVEKLRPIDTIGVLAFDNRFEWTVTPRPVGGDSAAINQMIANIIADGGTQIAPALTEAYEQTVALPATRKHIVLLTDGISEVGNSMDLARAATSRNVTISTIGLGRDVNRAYLQGIAEAAGGAFYDSADPQDLEQLLLRDVREHTGLSASGPNPAK